MSDPIVYVDKSEIRDGSLGELKAAINDLVRFVEENEPQLVSYAFYLDEAALRMTVVAIHPDSASMELHMKVGGPLFRKFKDFIRLTAIEVYGPVQGAALELLRQKAQMLGGATLVAPRLHSGFARR